jgi:hypothetical protein
MLYNTRGYKCIRHYVAFSSLKKGAQFVTVKGIIFTMDIKAGINTAIFLAILGLILSLWIGIQSIRSGRKLLYFRLRQQRISFGWRMIAFALGLALTAFLMGRYGEPAVYLFYEPSPTPSLTPTITLSPTITPSPTITLSPTITDTPSITDTPTITPTPSIPLAIQMQFKSEVTPNSAAVFSPMVFGQDIDLKTYEPINSATVFTNPIRRIVAIYSYDNMVTNTQWSALWYRNGQLVFYETKPWDGNTGGYGFAERVAAPDEWQPGEYEVQIFVGMEWKSVGRFVIQGLADTSTPTSAPTASPTISQTIPPSATHVPTRTPLPTMTRVPTRTHLPTDTPWPSPTTAPTKTH